MQNPDDFEPEKKREFGDLKVDKENGPQHTGKSLGQLCKELCIQINTGFAHSIPTPHFHLAM
jgi:hypothetical protein